MQSTRARRCIAPHKPTVHPTVPCTPPSDLPVACLRHPTAVTGDRPALATLLLQQLDLLGDRVGRLPGGAVGDGLLDLRVAAALQLSLQLALRDHLQLEDAVGPGALGLLFKP